MELLILLGVCVVVITVVAWVGRRPGNAADRLQAARTNREAEARLKVFKDGRRGMQ